MEFNYAITPVVIASYRTVTNCSASLQFRWTLPKKTRLGAHWSEHHCCVEGWLSLRRTTLGRNLRPAKAWNGCFVDKVKWQGQVTRSSEETSSWSLVCIVWCFSCWQFYQCFWSEFWDGASWQPHSVGTIDCAGCLWTAVSRSLPILRHVSRSAAEPQRSDAGTNIHGSRWPRTTLREFSHLCWYFKIEKTFFSKCLLQIVAVCQLGSVDSWIIWYWKCFWIVHWVALL